MRRTSGCRPVILASIGGLFTGFVDDLFDGPGFIFDDLFDVRGMDAAIQDQFGQRAAANLTADGVEAGDGDRIGRVVHDHIHTGGLLEGFDVASVASDDASLHLFVGQGDHGAGHFGHMLGGHALDGIRDQLAGALFTLFTRFRFDLADDAGHVAAGFFFNGGKQFLAGIVRGHLGDRIRVS